MLVLGGAVIAFRLISDGVSKEEFIEQADQICQDARDEAGSFDEPSDEPADIARLFAKAAPILEAQTEEIRDLESPSEQRDVLNEWLKSQEELARAFDAVAEAEDSGAQDAALDWVYLVEGRSSRLAHEYGFEVCAISTPS